MKVTSLTRFALHGTLFICLFLAPAALTPRLAAQMIAPEKIAPAQITPAQIDPGQIAPAQVPPGQVASSIDESIVTLEEFNVTGRGDEDDEYYDPTGMGGPRAEMDEPPFSNDLLAGSYGPPEDFDVEINNELQLAMGASPADLATAINRVSLRGFPTPRLRNGFSQTGVPEILNVYYTELIQGPITPVLGRAAPGGIQNFVTGRPTGRSRVIFSAWTNTHEATDVRFEETTPIVAKKSWQRFTAGRRSSTGPMDHAYLDTKFASGSITLRHSRAVSTMLSVDYQQLDGNPAPGVPEYRATARTSAADPTAAAIIGPYLPFIRFNPYGPSASIYKRLLSASLQTEAQLSRRVSLRASLFAFDRKLTQDRFTLSQFALDTQKFAANYREPLRISQPLTAYVASVEATARISYKGTDHKVTLLVERTRVENNRIDSYLPVAIRNTLPADVRTFDPYAPNYYRPAFTDELYSRRTIDRTETTDLTSVSLTERFALWRGKLVATAGIRMDIIGIEVEDDGTNTRVPYASDDISLVTWQTGANYIVKPGKLLVFASASEAIEPSSRTDSRTGEIQGNESTFGYEAGLKGLFFNKRLSATLLAFQYFNKNIARRNPLYDDWRYDADRTQPELLHSGEERFTGATLDTRFNAGRGFMLSGRMVLIEPVTTAAPDNPEEVGRILTRMPRTTIGLTTRYSFPKGPMLGTAISLTLTHIGSYIGNYRTWSKPDRNDVRLLVREYLKYPGNTLVSLSLSRTWVFGEKKRPVRHTIGLSVRNLLDRDQEKRFARANQNCELGASYRLVW